MATIAGVRLPADEVALWETMELLPEAVFEYEPLVASGETHDATFLRVLTVDGSRLDAALEADPSVADRTRLATTDGGWLYHVEWAETVTETFRTLTDCGGSITNMVGREGEWDLRVVFLDRAAFSDAYDCCVEGGLTPAIGSVQDLDVDEGFEPLQTRQSHCTLTPHQREALIAALEHGYFEIPRRTSLDDIAADLGISHQALSERLRRGYDVVVREFCAQAQVDAA
ncbi:helix-turn-helix domain-containing protein [Halomarina ordinaria]|uniref:Helix-turn-helix domain-containing protein n=1 Tax=Halomarina ordinaria TaxID=3033939 RepID=A0ABD5U911_9EURY|nr:helix-turn-helix domain-containing protein [Halomarina sp. PSRA2]